MQEIKNELMRERGHVDHKLSLHRWMLWKWIVFFGRNQIVWLVMDESGLEDTCWRHCCCETRVQPEPIKFELI